MSNALKGMVAGLVATLALSGLMVLNSATDLMPQIHIIRWLTALGTLSVPAAWMDHFIVGVIVWDCSLPSMMALRAARRLGRRASFSVHLRG